MTLYLRVYSGFGIHVPTGTVDLIRSMSLRVIVGLANVRLQPRRLSVPTAIANSAWLERVASSYHGSLTVAPSLRPLNQMAAIPAESRSVLISSLGSVGTRTAMSTEAKVVEKY